MKSAKARNRFLTRTYGNLQFNNSTRFEGLAVFRSKGMALIMEDT